MTDVEPQAVDELVQDAFSRALTNFKGTFFFGKKLSDGNYGHTDCSIHVQFDYAPDASMEDFLAQARMAALWGKSAVFEQLGIEAHLQGKGPDALLMEVVQDAFPGATTESVRRDPADPVQAVAAVSPMPPHSKEQVDAASDAMRKAMRKENADWARARYATHPGEFYDNRAKKAAEGWTSPDFTHKASRAGFYEN